MICAPTVVALLELLASLTEAPRSPWVAEPSLISSSETRLARLDGIEKPTPMLPDWLPLELLPPALAMATLMPISSPLLSSSAPPELPGLIDASVWMTGSEIVPWLEFCCCCCCWPPPWFGKSKLNGFCELPPPLPSLDFGTAEEAMLIDRLRALTMPSVTVPDRPSGAPMATVVSPTLSLLESPHVIGVIPLAPSSLMTARSVIGSVPTILAV